MVSFCFNCNAFLYVNFNFLSFLRSLLFHLNMLLWLYWRRETFAIMKKLILLFLSLLVLPESVYCHFHKSGTNNKSPVIWEKWFNYLISAKFWISFRNQLFHLYSKQNTWFFMKNNFHVSLFGTDTFIGSLDYNT